MTASAPDTGVWLEEEVARARDLLEQGAAAESVRVLAEAERVAVAQGYPQILAQVGELAAEIASRSEGATRSRAQGIVSKIRILAAPSRPPAPRPAPAPRAPKTSRLLFGLAWVLIAASFGVPLLALVLDSEFVFWGCYSAGYLGMTWLIPGVLIGVARRSWLIGIAATLTGLIVWSTFMVFVGESLGIDMSP